MIEQKLTESFTDTIKTVNYNKQYEQWWEQNKERILAEDKLNHDMQFKSSYAKHGDY